MKSSPRDGFVRVEDDVFFAPVRGNRKLPVRIECIEVSAAKSFAVEYFCHPDGSDKDRVQLGREWNP